MKEKTYKFKLRLVIFITCIISGTATYMILSAAANEGRKRAAMKTAEPDYVRYASMGYSFDTVSAKKNILISFEDGSHLARTHLFTFDCDKKTLDILEMPPQTLLEWDGFEGTLSDAYNTGVYKEIVGRTLDIKIDGYATMSVDAFSNCAALLGGIEIRLDNPITVSDRQLSKGERTLAGSLVSLLTSDKEAYVCGDEERVNAYRRLLASFIKKLDDKGALTWFPMLMDVIVNETKTDMSISELTELVNLCNKIKIDRISLHMLPGRHTSNGYYAADTEELAELLNLSFRVKSFTLAKEDLGFADVAGAKDIYKDIPVKINEILK